MVRYVEPSLMIRKSLSLVLRYVWYFNGELSNIGTVTDFDGAWSLDIFNYPVQVEVNSMGFATQRVVIQNASPVRITLKPDRNVLKEVSVVQQRLSEQQEKSALTVESMDALAIKESPSVSFYDHLER